MPQAPGLVEKTLKLGEVVKWAIKSLYLDEAIPRGPLLQWLLQMLLGVRLTHKDLQAIIDAEKGVRTEPPSPRKLNFHAVLEKDPPGFQGFVSDNDVIAALSEDLWAEAAICLSHGGWPQTGDVAHKYYVVASWLQDVSDKFRTWTFGRVLVVVRLAAQTDCILGHRAGILVPYEHSEECERRVNACTGLPTHVQDGESYVQSWFQLKECLHRLFAELREDVLEASKLKMQFRSHLNLELSETVFGHQSLSRLLADENLADEFTLETSASANRYTVRQNNVAVMATELKDRSVATAAVKETARILAHPPGLTAPSHDTKPSPPPGLCAPQALAIHDLAAWPTPMDASKDAPVNGTPISFTSSKTGHAVPPGLSPEKTARKAPPSEPPPPPPRKSNKIWASV
jgi:hypothetical protein